MIDVVTDLLGEIVEIYEWRDSYSSGTHGYSMRSRGTVRAVYVADKQLHVLLEHNLGYDSASYNDRTKDGGVEVYSLHEGRARVVQRCTRCGSWDQKSHLEGQLVGREASWEHKSGEGCKQVGSGG